MKLLGFLWRILLALITGFCITIGISLSSASLKEEIEKSICDKFQKDLGCSVFCRLEEINLLNSEIVFSNLYLAEKSEKQEKSWYWTAQKVSIQFSFFKFITHRCIDMHIFLRDVYGYTLHEKGQFPLFDHIQSFLISDSTIPFAIKDLIIEKGAIAVKDSLSHANAFSEFNCSMAALTDYFKLIVYTKDGTIKYGDFTLCENTAIKTAIEIPYDSASSIIKMDGSADCGLLQTNKQEVHFYGSYKNNYGNFTLATIDDSLCIHAVEVIHTKDGIRTTIDASVSLEHIQDNTFSFISSFSGRAYVKAQVLTTSTDMQLSCDVGIPALKYQDKQMGSCVMQTKYAEGLWHGVASMYAKKKEQYRLDWDYNQDQQKGSLQVTNGGPVALPFTRYWKISPNEGTLHCSFEGMNKIDGWYRLRATNEKLETAIDSCAQFHYQDSKATIEGALGSQTYSIFFDTTSATGIEKCMFTNEHGETLIHLYKDKDYKERVRGTLAFSLIKHLSLHLFDTPLGGQGALDFFVDCSKNGFMGRLFMKDTTIRLLQTHNFIRDFHANIRGDYTKGYVVLEDFLIKLQKGSIQSKKCCFYFDDLWHLRFAHIPLFAHKLFLNIEKDMFIIFSGSILGIHDSVRGSKLSGSLQLDQGQIKKNIFSSSAQKSIASQFITGLSSPLSDCVVDLQVETKMPHHIKASALDAQVTCNVALKGTIENLQPEGIVEIVNGSLSFPYKSIPIVSGKLFFSPPNTQDPAIELLARGKVKKYHVTLRVDGTISHPVIAFDASPPLTEEQIMTLLLSGSDDGSLVLAMPALLMHNVQSLLFSDEKATAKDGSFIKNVFKPFKSIRIVPNFSDQQARGGIRGSLIIDLNDRFHALIQKNFSLPEDTRFEVEYHVSDDMTVRGIKDEHSNLGGEVEVRWKF